jgi:O-succinylbenzoic acid--CoA ligase
MHNSFKLNGIYYSNENLKSLAHNFIKEGLAYEQVVGQFLLDWLNDSDFVSVNTSGSTGIPKHIKIKKQAMVNSAIATGYFFKLQPENTALHCLPTNFIAGKMMLVRAMVLGLELDIVEPKSQLVFDYDKAYHFCAMIPLQLQNTLKHCDNIETMIVGGASVSKTLIDDIHNIKSTVYETYGMTETVTHIAVKQLNNFSLLRGEPTKRSVKSYFKTLSNVSISQNESGCLVIYAPKLSEEKITTNDIVKIHSDTEFEWLGRFDNVINSGGVKLFPEQIEVKLQKIIQQRYFIASEKDNTLGEKIILVIESENIDLNVISNEVRNLITLDKFEIPKAIYCVKQFIETSSGKIQRKKTLGLLKG